jgi:hypothetical protein
VPEWPARDAGGDPLWSNGRRFVPSFANLDSDSPAAIGLDLFPDQCFAQETSP